MIPSRVAQRVVRQSPLAATLQGLELHRLESRRYLRRKRNYVLDESHRRLDPTRPVKTIRTEGLVEPFSPEQDDWDEYLAKASLSPWVPLPDVACRKIFDHASPDDFHVDLGSGDGRVCFHAIDHGLKRSLGVDVDPRIVDKANERLGKRHPQPPLEFVEANLLEESHPVWDQIVEANLLTMFFVTDALETLRPLLERKLAGRQLLIVTCGYAMPGWKSSFDEVVLGTTLYFYRWGNMFDDDDDESFAEELDVGILQSTPESSLRNALEGSKFKNVNDRRMDGYVLPGYDPESLASYDEDFDTDWEDEEDEEEEPEPQEPEKRPKVTQCKSNKKPPPF